MTARFELRGSIDVGISEPSDVVALPGERFFVVSDLEPLGAIVDRSGRVARVEIPGAPSGESGLEAVALDPDRHRLFVVAEEHHQLLVLDDGPRLVHAATHALPAIEDREATKKKGKKGKKGKTAKKNRNKGIEGMAFLPAALSPTGAAHLVLAKEARPRALVLLDRDGRGPLREIALDARIERACEDFSGLAVDPRTGHLFLCSDESAAVAEIELTRDLRAVLVGVTALADRRGRPLERVEGVAIDARGDLHVLLENDRTLHRFERA